MEEQAREPSIPGPVTPSLQGVPVGYEGPRPGRREDRAPVDGLADVYLATSRLGTIQDANRAAAALLRSERSALLGQPLGRFVVLEDRPRLETHLIRLRLGVERRGGGWEARLQPLDGAPFAATLTASVVRGANEQVVGFLWLIRDISRQKRTETNQDVGLQDGGGGTECMRGSDSPAVECAILVDGRPGRAG